MSVGILFLVLLAMLGIRVGYLALQLSNLGRFWYELERRGIDFHIARLISLVTLAAFLSCAFYALWKLDPETHSMTAIGGTAFVAWWGMSLLSRLAVHRFPRTNSSQLYAEAKTDLVVHLVTSVISGVCMTGVTVFAIWWRS